MKAHNLDLECNYDFLLSNENKNSNSKNQDAYFKMSLPLDKVEFVDTVEKFRRFLDEINIQTSRTNMFATTKDLIFVGIDSEWKPSCTTGIETDTSNKIAILQISNHEKVYLIDMIKLKCNYGDDDDDDDEKRSTIGQISNEFVRRFLLNKKIIKIGYSFTQDLRMISNWLVNVDCESIENLNDLIRQTVLDIGYLANSVYIK